MNGQPVVQLQAEQGQVPTHLQKLAGRGKKGFCFFVNILVNVDAIFIVVVGLFDIVGHV